MLVYLVYQEADKAAKEALSIPIDHLKDPHKDFKHHINSYAKEIWQDEWHVSDHTPNCVQPQLGVW